MKVSLVSKFPRKYNPFLSIRDLPISKITGRPADGLQKYEIDFLETASWTAKALNFVQNHQIQNNEFKNIQQKNYICFQTIQEFNYDYTVPQPKNNQVALLVKVNDIPGSTQVKTALKLICSDYYDSNSDLLKINAKDTINCPPQETCTLEDNIQHLSNIFSKILSTAAKDEFKKLEFHSREARNLEFPKEWLNRG